MSRTVSLSTLRSDVRFKADIGGATVRHTDAQLTRLINQSIQMFRERISDEGSTHYLVPYSGTLGVGPTSPYAFYQLDLSSGPSPALVRTYGIDVTIDGQVIKLEHVPFESRNDYGTIPGGSTPRAWAHFRTDQVAILPASSAAYPFTVWYLPKFTDLSADGDTFDGVAGWEEWVVWDVVCQVIARDQFPRAYAIAEQRRAEIEQRVIRGATKVTQAGGAHVGRDSFGKKLPYFLGGSREPRAVAGGPYVPAGGSVTNAMLADMTGPTVKGLPSGTSRPIDWTVASLTTYLSVFSTSQRGLVPPPVTTSNLFLRDDGTWASTAGAGAAAGPSGAIQYQAGGGSHAGASGFRIHGANPSLVAHLDGTFRITGGQLQVGSATTRIQSTGIDVGGGSVVNVATLVASALAAPAFTDTTAGLAPLSGGGTTNFLRADGTWTAPPGGSSSPGGPDGAVQFRDTAGGFAGASGIRIAGSGAMGTQAGGGAWLEFGAQASGSAGGGLGSIRAFGDFSAFGTTQSGAPLRIFRSSPTGSAGLATGGILEWGTHTTNRVEHQHFAVGTGGRFTWEAGATGSTVELHASGLDASRLHFAARSITVGSGIPNDQLSPMASGTVKGQMGADGTPRDIPIQSLTTALYLFDSTNRGVVPGSGGGSANFLRADGVWAAPVSGSTPTGVTNSQLAFMPTGTVKANLSGTAAPADVAIATLFAFSPTFTSTRPGTVPASDGLSTSYLNGAGGWTSPSGAPQFPPSGGVLNSQLAPVASGTVKGNLGPSGPVTDIAIPTLAAFVPTFIATRAGLVPAPGSAVGFFLRDNGAWSVIPNGSLDDMAAGTVKGLLPTSGVGTPNNVVFGTFMAFAPTFTDARMGVVPASGGGTTNFLRADGTWTTPVAAATPGGVSGNIQWNNGGVMAGASGAHSVAGGAALAIGPAALVADRGDLRVGSGFLLAARNASGIAQPLVDWWNPTGAVRYGSSGLARIVNEVASGGVQEFSFGGVTGTTARFLPTGLDASPFHISAKSLSVGHINGLPFDFNGLKRGLDVGSSSGMPSGLSLYLPRGAGSGANRYIIPSGAVFTGTQFVTLSPTGGRGGGVVRIEKLSTSASNFEVRTPTGTVLHAFPSGTKGWADFMFEKPSGAVFQLAGHADMY